MSDSVGSIKGIGIGGLSDVLLPQRVNAGISLKEVSKDASAAEVEKAGREFESVLLKQMFGEMWKSAPSAGGLSGSSEEQQYRDMFNDALAKEIAAGQGIGIRDVLVREIAKRAKKE